MIERATGQDASGCHGLHVITEAKKQRLAKELNTRVRYPRLTGFDDVDLFAVMADHMPRFKELVDATSLENLETHGPLLRSKVRFPLQNRL